MSDFTKLKETLASINTKVDELLAKVNTPPPADDQPAVDEAEAEAAAILAKLS